MSQKLVTFFLILVLIFPLVVIGTPSHVLGNILEETPISESSENVIQPKGPVIYVNSACQTVKTVSFR